MTRRSIGLALMLALLAAGVQSASAASFTFADTTFRSCWEDTEGFDANLQPRPLPSPLPAGTHFIRLTTSSDTGDFILNLDGTFTSTTINTNIRNVGVGNGQVGVSHSTCNGTWTFDAGSQTLNTQATCTFTNTTGGTNTGTVTGGASVYQLAGTILVRIGPDPPPVATVHVDQNGPTAAFDYQRVCSHSTTLHFLK
jgi:hypothetical protein